MAGMNKAARSRDMVLSMAVIMVPVLLIVWFFTQPGDTTPQRADVAGTLAAAEEQADYPLLVAQGLGDDWVPVRAAWAQSGKPWITSEPAVGDSWQVGYLSPQETYFGVQQRDESSSQFVSATTRDGKPVGDTVDFAGHTWDRYESADGRTRSLVTVQGEVTSVVTADTDFASLDAFASSLVEVTPTSN